MAQQNTARLVLKLVFRGTVLFLLLIWFVHAKLTSPRSPHDNCTKKHDGFLSRLACKADITERQVKIVLEELGPAVVSELNRGNQVKLPNFGRFRRVKTPAYSVWDESGKKKIIPAGHSVEYLPAEEILKVVNHPSGQRWAGVGGQGSLPPARIVPARFDAQRRQK